MYSLIYILIGIALNRAFKSAELTFDMWETWTIIVSIISVLITNAVQMSR